MAANLVAATAEFKAAHADDNGHGTHVAGIIGAVSGAAAGRAVCPEAACVLKLAVRYRWSGKLDLLSWKVAACTC